MKVVLRRKPFETLFKKIEEHKAQRRVEDSKKQKVNNLQLINREIHKRKPKIDVLTKYLFRFLGVTSGSLNSLLSLAIFTKLEAEQTFEKMVLIAFWIICITMSVFCYWMSLQ